MKPGAAPLAELATPEVARLLARALPRDARVLRGPGKATAICWEAATDDGPVGRFMRVDDGGMTRIGEIPRQAMAEALDTGDLDALLNGVRFDPDWLAPAPRVGVGADLPADPERQAALAELAEGAHPATLDVMARNLLGRDSTYRWLRQGGPAALAFADAHPWLAQIAVGVAPRETMATLGDGPDATARRVLAVVGAAQGEDAEALVRGLRHLALPERQAVTANVEGVAQVARMPRALFPSPVPPRTGRSTPGDLDLMAFYAVGRWVPVLAEVSGRDVRSLLGKVDGWSGYLDTLGRRADCPILPSMSPEAWPWHVGHDVQDRVADMAAAMAEQLVAPAAILAGLDLPRRSGAHMSLHAMARDPAHAAALRLLVGRRTLPALAEMTRAWHGRADAAVRAIVAHAGAAVPAGPRLFEDLDLGEGLYLASLHTPQELLDEGAAGAGADGIPGLDHCVGGYAEYVASGNVAIVSLRRRLPGGGFVRLSTAEVAFDEEGNRETVQHHGRGNGPPGKGEEAALERGLAKAAGEAWERLSAHREASTPQLDWAALVVDSGAWERVRDLWAFALTRPQRTMGPRELLACAGLST